MFTEQHREALQSAVDHLNQTIKRVLDECGSTIQVRPWANFNTDAGHASVEIDVTTGKFHIASR